MKVGFVGLGRMGLPMARNILRGGHTLFVHGRNEDTLRQLQGEGASVAGSVRELADSVEILCSCRVSPDQSLDVFLGQNGAIGAKHHDFLCIDLATVDPATSRHIAGELAKVGIAFLDAPVSGGPDGSAVASLSIMVGGSDAHLARARPVLD